MRSIPRKKASLPKVRAFLDFMESELRAVKRRKPGAADKRTGPA
jgi:hypothetical protein